MLVMQVRRFLSEGKFSGDKQPPIVRAMDIRMVAEKIQRIGELLENIQNVRGDLKSMLIGVRNYYSKSFGSFIDDRFEKAIVLWKEGKMLEKRYEKIQRNVQRSERYANAARLLQILRYSKEISMLIR